MADITQDGVLYRPISDSDADADHMLTLAAECETVLHVLLRPHSAELTAHQWVTQKQRGSRRLGISAVFPMPWQIAHELRLTDSDADKVSVDRYPAVDPAANTGILADHFYLLDSPQSVGRGHIFYAVEDPKNGAADATRSKQIERDSGAKARSHLPIAKLLTKNQILAAFADLVPINLASAMEDGLVWTSDARKARGTAGGRHSSLWDPVIMAIALRERYVVPMTKLNAAFNMHRFLDEWRDEWKDKSRPD